MRRAETVAVMQRELVERAIGGDHDAFSVLAGASIDRLHGVATLILHDRDRAQDAVQDALVSAWRDVRALRDPDAWEVWLHRLVVRACYRAAGRARRRSVVELQAAARPEAVLTYDPASAVLERDRLGRWLATLPLEQRAVLVLHFYIGMPLTAAAEVLDIPAGTAKSRLHRGLETLRDVVRTESEAAPGPFRERLA